jgi:hypothetical protein
MSDLQQRITAASYEIGQVEGIVTTNQNLVKSQQSLIDEQEKIKSEIQKITAKNADLDVAAETYDREFINRKMNVPSHHSYTLQDTVMALFFLSYGLLVIAAAFSFGRVARLTFRMTNTVLGLMISALILVALFVAFILFEIIRRYA